VTNADQPPSTILLDDRPVSPWTPTWRAEAVARWQARRGQPVPEPYESFTIRASPLNAARTSAENSSGSSHAAKCPPLSASLK
jgi:hypothetical protein